LSEYEKAIKILTSQGKFYINLGLERVQAFLQLVGNPQENLRFVHVAGTNGKGSVCAMLSSVLAAAGYKTGLFTSPHIFEYTERFKIDNKDISKEIFAQKVIEITELSQKNHIHLTEFEILAVLAFEIFAEEKVDIVVLETGLGGRFDATNVIEKNICSIIAHIDFDHTERLGNTIEKIAFEKAGIIKSNCPVLINKTNFGLQTIKKVAQERNSEVFEVNEAPNFWLEKSALKGLWQKENLALVLKAVEILNEKDFTITDENIVKGLEQVKHPCRFQYLPEKSLIIDGAHNPNGAKGLRESLDYYFKDKKIRFIFGCLKNKKYEEMMKNLFRKGDEIYFYHYNYPNANDVETLKSACEFPSHDFSELILPLEQSSELVTVICGSFYMIKELLEKIGLK
jgi:dihydrofolate synthase/folylpolyglutamate synthase